MKTVSHAEAAIPLVPYRRAPLVLLLLTVSILAITWPWARTCATAVLDHWDPPFHAWKLEFVARTILSGHLLPPDGDTNMYYPYSGALYFEALHWPQALVAAPLFALPHPNPVLIYHAVLTFFWALSGLCFWMLLHALGATRRAAVLGALFFTLMPYRISYLVEFNMQLCFGLPLFFFFLVRFFQRPSIRYACGMAVAWWLQAASELYQAVFLLLILPFPGLSLMAARWPLLRSFRRFWLPAAAAAALGGGLTFALLGPYLTMLNVHAVNRNLMEIATHILEPLSYLRPGGKFHFLHSLDVRRDEMIVYPTVAIALLAALHLAFDARRLFRIPVPRWIWVFRAIRWTALFAFLVLTFAVYFLGAPSAGIGHVYALLPVVATFASVLVLFHPTERDPASLFMTGLFAGAVFAFFMSMGPWISIRHSEFGTVNYLYLWIYNHLSALQGFRVVSRFSIYLLFFMVAAAALAWSQIERRWLQRRALRWLWIVPLLVAIPESMPPGIRVRPLEYPLTSPVLDALDRLGQPFVLAMVPMGDRSYDSRFMLQIARTDRLSVYAWGGAYPRYTQQVRAALDPVAPQPAHAAELLRQLWPECFLLEDKLFTQTRRTRIPRDYAQLFAGEADVFAEDDRFALLRLKPGAEPAAEQLRLIRHDFIEACPQIVFRARTPADAPPAVLWLDVNGYPVGRWEIGPDSREFQILVPDRNLLPILPNRLRFHAEGDAPFHLDAFRAEPASPGAAPAEIPSSLECPPWVGHLHHVPASAMPLDVHYPHGFALLACAPPETAATIGGSLRLRLYVRCPRAMEIAVNTHVHARLTAPDGSWIESAATLDENGDLNDVRCQVHPAIYALDLDVELPERLAPGDYALSFVVRDAHGDRLAGKQNGKRGKQFPVSVPIRIQAPAAP